MWLTADLSLSGRQAIWAMTSEVIAGGVSIKAGHSWNCTDDHGFLFGDSECNTDWGEWPSEQNPDYMTSRWRTEQRDYLSQDSEYWYLFGWCWRNTNWGTQVTWCYPPVRPLQSETKKGPYFTYTFKCDANRAGAAKCWFPDW